MFLCLHTRKHQQNTCSHVFSLFIAYFYPHYIMSNLCSAQPVTAAVLLTHVLPSSLLVPPPPSGDGGSGGPGAGVPLLLGAPPLPPLLPAGHCQEHLPLHHARRTSQHLPRQQLHRQGAINTLYIYLCFYTVQKKIIPATLAMLVSCPDLAWLQGLGTRLGQYVQTGHCSSRRYTNQLVTSQWYLSHPPPPPPPPKF